MSDNENLQIYKEIFEKEPSAIIILDERGIVSKANKAAIEMLNTGELVGRKWYQIIEEVFRPRPDDGQEISTKDGKRLNVATKPLTHGQLVQMTDQTLNRELADKLSHMQRLSSLGRMAASLAHQIRTPLSAAMLYAANLGNAKLPQASRALFQKKLVSRLEALEGQVSDILMYARSGEQNVKNLDLTELLLENETNLDLIAQKNQGSFELIVPEYEIEILGNTTALNGAISNLVNNAYEAGAKNVTVKLEEEEKIVKIMVSNDGPKIDENAKKRIFEPFFTTKSNGTGLGLAVVAAVARVHQGQLALDSNDTQTTFTIILPRFKK